jgi:WhiB family redox-sensing transcriptional regulator
MNTTTDRVSSAAAAPAGDWHRHAACRDADPGLFFPERGADSSVIEEAKAICAVCPVEQQCLDEAFRMNDQAGIWGGLTVDERNGSLTLDHPLNRHQEKRLTNRTAREIAMDKGADMLVWLVKRQINVPDVADLLGAHPHSVCKAFRMLVPPAQERDRVASVVERVMVESSTTLRELERIGRSHRQIAQVLGTSQDIISACLRVLAQRDEALARVSRKGVEESLRLCQESEKRIRQESRYGLTVQDVVEMYGTRIRRLAQNIPLRRVALELGVCRETVRLAYREMTQSRLTRAA